MKERQVRTGCQGAAEVETALQGIPKDKDWHRFRAGDLMGLLDVNTGSLFKIDEAVWDLLEVYDGTDPRGAVAALSSKYGEEGANEALSEIQELRKRGLLGGPDPLSGRYVPPEPDHVKALCLLVTNDCNLRCRYCFAGGGRVDRSRMSPEVARRSLDFLLESLGRRSGCEVDFFGGEPLLVFDVVRDAILYGEEKATELGKKVKFTLTTNGVLLTDEIVRFLVDHDVSLILSMDGRPAIHDAMRVLPDGRGTYDLVLAKYRKYVLGEDGDGSDVAGKIRDYWIRGTFTRQSLDFTSDVAHLVELGFTRISMEPVVAEENQPYAIAERDLEALRKEYERLFSYYVKSHREGKTFFFYHFMLPANGGPCAYKRVTGCGAGVEYFAVTPSGELYPCHRFAQEPKFRMGDVFTGFSSGGSTMRKLFAGTHVYSKEACAGCWARFYCGGGCHASAWEFNRDISRPHELSCEIMKMRLEHALLAEIALSPPKPVE